MRLAQLRLDLSTPFLSHSPKHHENQTPLPTISTLDLAYG